MKADEGAGSFLQILGEGGKLFKDGIKFGGGSLAA
jgi:hypothetical protein